MDRIRSAFNSVIKNERYSRFTLQPAEDGERHVEVKLSDDATDDTTEAERQAGGSLAFRPALPYPNRRNLCYLILGTLLIFVTGYLIGYVSHRKPQTTAAPLSCDAGVELAAENQQDGTRAVVAPVSDPQLDWKDVTKLLKQKLTSQAFEKILKDYDMPRRSAGSDEDKNLANRIYGEFRKQEMDPWTDIHYVQLQMPDRLI